MKEALARIKINKLLEVAGWRFFPDAKGPANIQLEPSVTIKAADLEALGNNFEKTEKGFIDYLLLTEKGFPFIVLEAKAEDKDPLDGKEQARKYARSQNCRIVLLSNGNLHYLWDLDRGNPYVITTFPTPTSALHYQKVVPDPKRLIAESIGRDYIALTQRPTYAADAGWKSEGERPEYIRVNKLRFLRGYQQLAVQAIQRAVKDGKDRFLFEMATGTGKTLLAAAVIKLFLRTANAGRVLFLVDRLELEEQARKNFVAYLKNDFKTVVYKENRDDWRKGEIVVSTVQSLLFNNKYQQLFSPTDFDLVISDEAHRSIGGNARAVFDYFIGYKLGLTATPRDFLKNFDKANPTTRDPREQERRLLLDTYRTFGCENSQPTFRYSLVDGVNDPEGPFLVNPIVADARTEITTQLLSDEGFVVNFTDDEGEDHEETYKQTQFEKRFFAGATNAVFCKTFLDNAMRDPISGEIGKSIVFAVSRSHARKLTQILNGMADKMFPGKYQSDFAVQVTSGITGAQQMTVNFANNNLLGNANFLDNYRTSKARVCVTVGMMTTGYDCEDLLNVAFMRPVFSPTEFIQMKGRGTRLHDFREEIFDAFLKASVAAPHKKNYKLFDFFASCQYFEEEFSYDEVIDLPPHPTSGSAEPGGGGGGPLSIAGAYEHLGADIIASMKEEAVGPQGMKIDRMLFQKFEQTVKSDDKIAAAVNDGRWEEVIDYVNREIFDKPDDYYTLEKLRQAAAIDRRLTLREILQKVFGLIPSFKSKNDLLEEEFSKFVADYKPTEADALPAIKNYFKAYATSDQVRHIIENKTFADLATNPTLSLADFKAVPEKYRNLIPEYIKDYVSLNQFAAQTHMLDSETKRRIDTARDILVGKVPDPKSQVEQITIALIYKFMDDMDAQAEELGGKRKFFAGEFAQYGWAKLMAPSVSGEERIGIYADGMVKMPQNPGAPPLFRAIFKNAYLPYRDPETLKAFLKTINEFDYDHSERLGDAFEYLLSVLGSQGDAGQFRTPRHIIDFIVSIVDPKKNETVLDPACGTAGFMISAFKHIMRANSTPAAIAKTNGNGEAALHTSKIPPAKGDKLTPEERKKLADNFRGYDISPDMVRLSLVNMYLHGFTDPHVYEYDTLTSQDRWNEMADVILANPPFMSPKGGIKPHNRFSVPSKRSEVLFVDYMAEHLTPGGRAGIIVPEGIIFQSQTAYKALRKMLIEKYLVTVVSLPAGVFNPYSGVKTSILILDKSLAKHSDTVGFFKVENDGFNLGAQRRPIDRNDLPQVLAEIEEYLRRLRAKEPVAAEEFTPTRGLIVSKEKIAANGDFNLSGERYHTAATGQTRFPMVPLGELAEFIRGITFAKSDQLDNANKDSLLVATTKAAQESGIVEEDLYHIPRSLLKDDNKLLRPGDILISTANSLNLLGRTTHVRRVNHPMAFGAFMSVIRPNGRILDDYLIRLLRTKFAFDFYVRNANTTTNISNLNLGTLAMFEIPLPPLEVQKEIVAEIEAYQKVIDGARAVLDHYRPHIPINPEWPTVELGEIAENLDSRRIPITESDRKAGPYPYYGASGVVDHVADFIFDEDILLISEDGANLLARSTPIAFSVSGKVWVNNHAHVLRFPEMATQKLVEIHLNSISIAEFVTGSAQPKLNQKAMSSIRIPLPPFAEQEKIVAEIEAEQGLVEGNQQLIERMEKKIAATLARIWGEEPVPADPTDAASEREG